MDTQFLSWQSQHFTPVKGKIKDSRKQLNRYLKSKENEKLLWDGKLKDLESGIYSGWGGDRQSAPICWEKFLTLTETQLYFRQRQADSHPNMETSCTIYSPFVFIVIGSQIKTPNLELDGGHST